MISQHQLDKLLFELEQDRVEKTVSVANKDKFGEALCAFANDFPNHQKPGYLIVGVNDDGTKSGLPADEQILQTLMSFRTDGRIVPPPVITILEYSWQQIKGEAVLFLATNTLIKIYSICKINFNKYLLNNWY